MHRNNILFGNRNIYSLCNGKIQPGDCSTVDNLEVKSWSGFGSTVDPVFSYQLFTPFSMTTLLLFITVAIYPQFMVFFLFSSSATPLLWVLSFGFVTWTTSLSFFNSTISQCNLKSEIVIFLRFIPILIVVSLFALLFIYS